MAKKKLSLDEIQGVLNKKVPQESKEILKQLEELLDEDDAPKKPRVKYKNIILANDSAGELIDTPLAVVQVPEDFDADILLDKLSQIGIMANNDAQQAKKSKLKKNPLKSIGDILENCPKKYFKELKIKVLSVFPTHIVETDNSIKDQTNNEQDSD